MTGGMTEMLDWKCFGRTTRVYVAGPNTKGDPEANTHTAILIGNKLFDWGYVPFIPHLTHYWHAIVERPYEDWLRLDSEWLVHCHVLLRFPGESSGAEREIVLMQKLMRPVYYDLVTLRREVPTEVAELPEAWLETMPR